jgi:hypothetical protein
MSSDFTKSGASGISGRFRELLRGRTATPWANWLGISQGTLSRLKKGELPDPEKLTAVCRAENLSLTWLLDGLGSPYLVHHVVDEEDAERAVDQLLADEPWLMLLVVCEARALVVLHQAASIEIKNARCDYMAVEVITGCYDAHSIAAAFDRASAMQVLEVDDMQWWRLATGYMSATELFGWPGEPGGLAAAAEGYAPVDHERGLLAVAESAPSRYGDDELVRLANELKPADRDVVLRMLRGLTQR